MRLFVLVILLSIISACAQKSGTTNAKFKLTMGALGTPDGFSGGLIIYGKSSLNDDHFVKIMESSTTQEYEIPNGMWSFYAIGWDGTDHMTGKATCAKAMNVGLNGSPVDVELSVANINCKDAVYGQVQDVSGEARFPKIKIETCNNLSSSATSCNYNSAVDTYENNKGYFASYKIIASSYFKEGTAINSMAGSLESTCINVNQVTSGLVDDIKFNALNIPAGVEALKTPFNFVLQGYYNQDCNETRGSKKFILKHGAKSNSFDFKSSYVTDTGVLYTKIYTSSTTQEICNATNIFATEFPAGLGTPSLPYVICNPKQLSQITELDKFYVLGKDLDMGIETALLKSFNDLDCTEMGDNFVPIGGHGVDVRGNLLCFSDDNIAGREFTGSFDGLNYTITNLRLENAEKSNIGLFRYLTNATVQNLKISNAVISGTDNLGILAGVCDGCIIKNVYINNSQLRSENTESSNIGMVVGSVSNTSQITKAYVWDSFIGARRSSSIGGIAGDMTDSDITKSVAENVIIEGTKNIGGVVGVVLGNSTLIEVGHTGAIFAEGDDTNHFASVGGVVGEANTIGANSPVIQYAFSNTFIVVDRELEVLNLGGIIGLADNGVNLKDSYSVGKLKFRCKDTTNANCKVGSLVGNDLGAVLTDVLFDSSDFVNGYGGTPAVNGTITLDGLMDNGGGIKTALEEAPSDVWNHVNGFFPRFKHETQFPCNKAINLQSVNNQLTNGRGSADDPIRICSKEQLLSIGSDHYRLETPLKLGDVTNGITNLRGTLDGNNKFLYGLDLKGASGADTALIQNVSSTGVVKNLKIFDSTISEADNTKNNSILAASNAGVIENILVVSNLEDIIDLSTNAPSNIENFAMIVSSNSGTLKNVKARGYIVANSNVAGIANVNSGLVTDCRSDVRFELGTNLDNNIGGVVANNSGEISKCVSESSFVNYAAYAAPPNGISLGGIAGVNSGKISDSTYGGEKADNYVEMKLHVTAGNLKIGGIAGTNSGTILRTYVSANMDMSSDITTANTAFGAIVGENTGGTVTDSYSLNTFNKYLGSAFSLSNQSISCAPTNEISFQFPNINDSNDLPLFANKIVLDSPTYAVKLIGEDGNFNHIEEQILISVSAPPKEIYFDATNNPILTVDLVRCPTMTTDQLKEIKFVEVYDHNDAGEIKTFDEMTNHLTYCPELDSVATLSESEITNFKCINGFDMASFGDSQNGIPPFGFNRMLNTFKNMIGISTTNPDPPVWEIDVRSNEFPRIFKIDDH